MEDYLLDRKADAGSIIARGRAVIATEAAALTRLSETMDTHFAEACQLILGLKRQLVVSGMGKSGHVARQGAATFAATGTPAIFVHPAEAAHGDLGMVQPGDALLILSNSGNTAELRQIISHARRLGVPIIGVAARRNSLVIELADVPLLLPRVQEACPANLAPTSSTTMQMALADALAMTVMELRGVSQRQLRALHPAGAIGLALTPVSELMHTGERMPLVPASAGMPETISVMTAGCFGLAGVIDAAGALIGIITDGDLRRRFDVLETAFAHEVMTPAPKVLPPEMPAGDALTLLSDNRITAAFVVDDPAAGPQPPLGIVHLHDLLRFGLN